MIILKSPSPISILKKDKLVEERICKVFVWASNHKVFTFTLKMFYTSI